MFVLTIAELLLSLLYMQSESVSLTIHTNVNSSHSHVHSSEKQPRRDNELFTIPTDPT